jgi:hypothetical protein
MRKAKLPIWSAVAVLADVVVLTSIGKLRTSELTRLHHSSLLANRICDTPVSPRVSPRKPNQEPLFHVNQSKHEHQINLSNKEFTKYMLKSVIIKTIETFER